MNQNYHKARKLLTALMLSPGMLFAAAYLMLWLSTNFYLDHRFREHLSHTFDSEAGKRYRLTIGDLGTDFELDSLRLERLELIPVTGTGELQSTRIRIDKLDIPCPEIGLFLFSPSKVDMTTRAVSRQLLCRCRPEALSMDHQARPIPADR